VNSLDHVWQEVQEPQREMRAPATMAEHIADRPLPARPRSRSLPLAFLATAMVAASLVVVWLATRTSSATPVAAGGGPVLVSQAQLERLAASSDHPIYWAGPKAGYAYEVTTTKSGRFYVRYLPAGLKAGDPRSSFLVVGTYSGKGSFADLKRAAKQRGAVETAIDKGGISVFSQGRPTSVYFSYPGADYQVEVYAPSGTTSRRLVYGGTITPVPAP
jgi:hypothetical protein